MVSEQSLVTMLSELINVKDLVYDREVEFKYNNRDIRIHCFNTVVQITDVTNALLSDEENPTTKIGGLVGEVIK